MTKTYLHDLHAPWLEAELYERYREREARGKKTDPSEILSFREELTRLDPGKTVSHGFFHEEAGTGAIGREAPPLRETTLDEFHRIAGKLGPGIRRSLKLFFKNDPEAHPVQKEGEDLPEMILFDLNGDGVYQAGLDSVLVQKEIAFGAAAKKIWTDNPGVLAEALGEKSEKNLEGRTVYGLLAELKGNRREEIFPGEIAAIIEAIPFSSGEEFPPPPEVSLILKWFHRTIRVASVPQFKNAVLLLLLLARKGYLDAVLTIFLELEAGQWDILFEDPLLATRIPAALQMEAGAGYPPLHEIYQGVTAEAKWNKADYREGDPLLLIAAAMARTLPRGGKEIDEAIDLFEYQLEKGTKTEPGRLLVCVQALRELASHNRLSDIQKKRVRNLTVDFMESFRGYARESARKTTRYLRQSSAGTEKTPARMEGVAETIVMDTNHEIVFNSFWILYELGGDESIRAVLKFNERGLDAEWGDRNNFYVEYYKRNAADEVYRYLTGHKKGLYTDRDLDIFNQWGREIQRNAEFRKKIEISGNFSPEKIVEAQDGFNRHVAMGKVIAYALSRGGDWRGYPRGDLDLVRRILHSPAPNIEEEKYRKAMGEVTERELHEFDRWLEQFQLVVFMELVFHEADRQGVSPDKLGLDPKEDIGKWREKSPVPVDDEVWEKYRNALTPDQITSLGRKAKELRLSPSSGRILSKNYVVLHILRHAVEAGEDWREYHLEDEGFVKGVLLKEGFNGDYDPEKLKALLSSLTEDEKRRLEAVGERYKNDIGIDLFQEGIDQYRLEHYLFDVPVCRLMILTADFNRQSWTWGMHGKLMGIFEAEKPPLTETEILVSLEGMKNSDFNVLLPGWVLKFASDSYPPEIREKALWAYGAARYPSWWVDERFESVLNDPNEPLEIKEGVKAAGRKGFFLFSYDLPEPRQSVEPLGVKPRRRHRKSGTAEEFKELIDLLNHPDKFCPKDYRRIIRQMIRVFGGHAIEVLLAIVVKDLELELENWPVFNYIFDNLILSAFGTKKKLNESMEGFVSHASNQGGEKIVMNIFSRAVIKWLDSGVDGGEFFRAFMDNYDEGELGDAMIETGFNETRRAYAVRGLKAFRLRALSETSRLMDEITAEIQRLDDTDSGRRKDLEALWSRLYEIQALVAFDA